MVDQVRIYVKAGNGGRGVASFFRNKFIRPCAKGKGIPDGGDGGRGGDVIIRANPKVVTLLDLKFKQHFEAPAGGHGSGNDKKGKDGEALILDVPVGVVITDLATQCIVRDLNEPGMQVIVVKGGKGGLGNRHPGFEDHQSCEGESRTLLLDLKVIADVGIIGLPNAGKSTLITVISHAHSRIADYPFTTKYPVLGVVERGEDRFTVADIPGLIEGSHQGKGLGTRFLRHVERTKILIHMVDMAALGRDPLEDYRVLNKELEFYSEAVAGKPQILVANKMDVESAKDNLKRFKKSVKTKIYPISALTKIGLEALIEAVIDKL